MINSYDNNIYREHYKINVVVSCSHHCNNILITTLCPPKNVHPPFYFLNDSCQKLTNFNDFWLLNSEKIVHENLTDLSTSPVRCSYFTVGNPKKVFQL